VEKSRSSRQGKIYKTELEQIGFTRGCPCCESYSNMRMQRGRKEHSDECRTRVMREMERLNMPGAKRLRDGERRVSEKQTARMRSSGIAATPVAASSSCATATSSAEVLGVEGGRVSQAQQPLVGNPPSSCHLLVHGRHVSLQEPVIVSVRNAVTDDTSHHAAHVDKNKNRSQHLWEACMLASPLSNFSQ